MEYDELIDKIKDALKITKVVPEKPVEGYLHVESKVRSWL